MQGINSIRGESLGPTLTFAWLYARVQDYVASTSKPGQSRIERWSFWVAMGAAGAGLIVGATWTHWLPPTAALLAVKVLLATELVGLLLSVGLMLIREASQFLRSRQVHADEMDVDFGKWLGLVVELRQFSPEQRGARLRFVQSLRTNMDNRMGVVFGGVQRLGIFPLLIALYFQFRDWKWGDWGAAFDVNLFAGLLIFAMLLMYGMGWLLVGLRTRLDTYASVLQESLGDASDAMRRG
jgi:hypothetical protein